MILNAARGQELPVYGDGLQIRDWLHVQDHCDALLAVLEHGTPGETYCIGGNNERTNIERRGDDLRRGRCRAGPPAGHSARR